MYRDVPGLCKVAGLADVEKQNWSLNPGRYVGFGAGTTDGEEFAIRMEGLAEELELLRVEAHELEERVSDNVISLLGAQR